MNNNKIKTADSPLAAAVADLNQLITEVSNCCAQELDQAVELCCQALRNQKKILFFGNGGSATQAQHLAAELINRFLINRKPLAALALTPDAAVVTSIGNDFSFDEIFSRQIIGLGQPGDIAIALSTSGTSKNIVSGLKQAQIEKMPTIGLLGRDGGRCREICDIAFLVPSAVTARIQEVHLLLGHLLCGLIEEKMTAA